MKQAFKPIVNQDSKILILGSMPGEKSLELNQYYGHSTNQFWKIMFALFDLPVSHNYKDRLQLLLDNGIALWDVLNRCDRVGSSDSKITSAVANDFQDFYTRYPRIKTVFLDSASVAKLYDKHVRRSPDKVYYTLPSPSARYASINFEQKLMKWWLVKEVLDNYK